jgi:ribosome-associated heat shock protein Hsp15
MPKPPTTFESSSVRVDKWLWAARLFKSRSAASEACDAGHVKVAGRTAKPSRALRRGERVLCQTPGGLRILEVVELADKRGPAAFARTLYVDHSPPRPPRGEEPILELRAKGAGRPTKRDRRLTDRLRRRRGP